MQADGSMLLSDQQVMFKINCIDLEEIKTKMILNYGWRPKQAELLCQQYRNYLFLIKKYGQDHHLVPSDEIDEIWHEHILESKKYFQDCENVFGRYIHHNPGSPWEDPNSDARKYAQQFEITQELYKKEFGDYIYMIKPLSTKRLRKAIKFKLRMALMLLFNRRVFAK